ncbi:MAG: CHAT domain-containing tetratricopeptide repeat protein [Planctomycetota bacterium]
MHPAPKTWAVLGFLAIGGAHGALAADAPPPAAPAPAPTTVEQVVAAAKAGDAARLAALSSAGRPDPWIVVEELLATGERDAAAAFARAAPRPAVARLPAYVEMRWDVVVPAEARQAVSAAEAALRKGDADAALALLEKLGARGDDVHSIRGLLARGSASRSKGRVEVGQAAFGEAAERAERIGAAWLQSEALRRSGDWALEVGDLRTARARFERTLAVREAAQLTGGVVRVRLNLVTVLESMAEYAEGRTHAERALCDAEASGSKTDEAIALGLLGTLSDALGDLPAAIAYGERAVALFVAAGDRHAEAVTLGNLATTEASMGRYPRALDHLRRAHKAMEALGDRRAQASSLTAQGALRRRLGNYAEALADFDAALRLVEALGDVEARASVLLEMSRAHQMTGDAVRAEATLRRGLADVVASGARRWLPGALVDLSGLVAARGEAEEAAALLDRARRSFDDVGDRVGAAGCDLSIGRLALDRGALDAAQKAFASAEAVGTELQRPSLVADAVRWTAWLDLRRGRLPQAVEGFERSAASYERARLRDRTAAALAGLAQAQLASGKAELSIATARRAVGVVSGLLRGQADDLGGATRAQYAAVYDTGLLAAERASRVEDAVWFVEAGRAGSLIEALENRGAVLDASLPEALAQEAVAARTRDRVAQAALQRAVASGDRETIRARMQDVAAAEEGLSAVRQRMQREAKRTAEVLYHEPATLDEVRGLLADGDAMVLYALLDVEDAARALVVTRDGARVVKLGTKAQVEAACDAVAAGDAAVDPTAAVAALRARVVDPLGLPTTTKRVLVSPDGALSLLPPSLLFGTEAAPVDVACVLSGTGYATLREERATDGTRVLALGDPDYDVGADPRGDLSPVAVLRGSARLVRLPGTRDEAKAVGDQVLLGKDATIDGLRAALGGHPRWHAVHLACHGLARVDDGMLSSLALTPADGDGGMLTAADVFSTLRVPADLVVLSACETSRGRFVRGEGVYGLTRAFLFAGASRVIVSLWKVDDRATQTLMTTFYARWKAGSPPAKALREAQAAVRADPRWKHPAYWAGWVLWGLPD